MSAWSQPATLARRAVPLATDSPGDAEARAAVLTCRDLGREYHGRHALAGLSLNLYAAEGLALVGANGAGKSTVLKLASGLLLPSAGDVSVLGREPGFDPGVRAALGFLGHEGFLEADEAVAAQLHFAHALRGGGAPGPDEVRQAFELDEVWDADGGTLSRGFTRRVELAYVVVGGPQLLLLDEPLGGLDAARQAALPDVLRGLLPQAAILVATHSLGALATLCPVSIPLIEGIPGERTPAVE